MTRHLSDILGIYPESQPCVGWAPSKGRQCRNPTNARNRRHAVSLLDQGTRLLKAGQSIDHVLEELAPLVLCRHYHQNQAAGLTDTWVSRVDEYIAKHRSPPRSSPSRSMPRRSPSPRMRDETRIIENRLAELERKMQDAIRKAERAEREKERARRDAERTRRDTEDMVRRSAAMGYARGQEEARRRASPPSAVETETTTVERNEAYGFQRNSESSGLLSSRRQDPRGGSVETTLQVNTSTSTNVQLRRSTIVSTTRVQRTSDGPATPAQAERHAATPSSVSRIVEIGDTSDALATPSPAQQSSTNATSGSSTPSSSTRRALSLPSAETDHQLPSPPTSNNEESRSTTTDTPESTTTQDTTTQPTPTSTSASTSTPQHLPTPPSTPPPSTPPTISEHGITRHPIEGDCCICLCALQNESTEHNHTSDDDTSLVWCQKQCGKNFHRECMDRWIASALEGNRQTSCPMCRGQW
ncbi:similar to An14g04510 [Aspergillus luchuensis]|uniref:Similar to An14g04510 n=1 Tax=Aspergillus kawachii TaxID=1069201 RepID=A0A146EZ46_ASPKA|nr:similar to An14g04510 [Aspergillus luchuensis]